MRVTARAVVGCVALLAIAGTNAAAQDHTTAAGYGAGFVDFGALNPGAEGVELAMDAGWIVTIFGETWHAAGGRMGARLNGGFTQRPLHLGEDAREINTWMLDASLMLRLLPPREGNPIAPFLSVGGGLMHYGLGTGGAITLPDQGVVYGGDDQLRWTVVGGGGIDIVPAGFRVGGMPLGVRLEAANHVVVRSPFRGLEDDESLGPIHNLRFGISLMGLGWF